MIFRHPNLLLSFQTLPIFYPSSKYEHNHHPTFLSFSGASEGKGVAKGGERGEVLSANSLFISTIKLGLTHHLDLSVVYNYRSSYLPKGFDKSYSPFLQFFRCLPSPSMRHEFYAYSHLKTIYCNEGLLTHIK